GGGTEIAVGRYRSCVHLPLEHDVADARRERRKNRRRKLGRMVGMSKPASQVRLGGAQNVFSDRRIEHSFDGKGRAGSAHGRQPPNLGMRRTGFSFSSDMTTRMELLERDAELETLAAAFAEAAAGRGGVVVV